MKNETWFAMVMNSFDVKTRSRALLGVLTRLSGRGERADLLIGRAVEQAFAEFAQEMAEE